MSARLSDTSGSMPRSFSRLETETISTDILRDCIQVDLSPSMESFHAVKKFLGEKGPFDLPRAFTVQEKVSHSSETPPGSKRVHYAQLVLGYGLHSVQFEGNTVFVWYREMGDPVATSTATERYEKITVFVKEQPKTHAQNGAAHEPWKILRKFINDALEFDQYKDQEDTQVYMIEERYQQWKLATERPKRPLDSVFLPSDVKDDIVRDITAFLASRDFYKQHGIPFKRGYLLWGPPGCGKTSLVQAVVGHFNMSICVLQIGHKGVTDNVLAALFRSAPTHSCILIEDIDTIFVDRNRLNLDQSVTYSGFINALDGVGSAEGKIVVITTNNPAKLDSALLRPGRIDRQYKIDFPDGAQIEEMFLKFYPEKKKKAAFFRDTVQGNKISAAEIQQYFIKHKDDPSSASKNRHQLVDHLQVQRQERELMREEKKKDEALQQGGSGFSSYISLW